MSNTKRSQVGRLRLPYLLLLIPTLIAALAAHAVQVVYEYDDAGRLKKVIYPNMVQRNYTLDPAGNRNVVQTVMPTGGALAFVNASASVQETAGTVQLSVRRSNSTGGAVTVAYSTTDGSANAGSDYTTASGTLTWTAGDGSDKSITIVLRDDTSVESSEEFLVTLSDPTGGAQLGSIPKATVTIVSDDVPDTIAPSVPANLSAGFASPTSVNLSWSASVDTGGAGLAGYVIFRNGVQQATSSSASFSDTVANGARHTYTVAAYDAAGNTSAQSNAVIPSDTLPPTVPGTPTGTVLSSTQIDLRWGASTDLGGAGLDSYRLYRNGAVIATLTGTSFGDSGLSPGTTYTYTVDAYDRGGYASSQSAPLSIATSAGPAVPAIPGNILANGPGTNNRINFSWNASPGATRYELYDTTNSPLLIYSGATTTFSVTRAAGNIYTFHVLACNAGGCSPASPTRRITIDCQPVSCL
jgi:chitodextrinase